MYFDYYYVLSITQYLPNCYIVIPIRYLQHHILFNLKTT